jgi:hypothetical protein
VQAAVFGGTIVVSGAAFVVFLLFLAVLAVAGDEASAPKQEAPKQAPKHEAPTKDEPKQPKNVERAAEKQDKPPKPEPLPPPHDPEERILYFLKKKRYDLAEAGGTQVVVQTTPAGCKSAVVNYKTTFVGSSLPSEAADYYKAILGDVELRNEICFVRTNAYRSAHDKYGNEKRVRLLTTSMGQRTMEKINWDRKGSVNFVRLYDMEYMAPSAKADIAQENARHAMDCLQDEGMFDFDFDC